MYNYLSPPMLQRTLSSQRQKILELIFSNHFAHLTAIDQVVLIFEGTLKRKICILCTALGDNFNFVVNISQRLWHLKLTDAVIMTPLCAFPQKANLVGFIEGWKRATRQKSSLMARTCKFNTLQYIWCLAGILSRVLIGRWRYLIFGQDIWYLAKLWIWPLSMIFANSSYLYLWWRYLIC